MAKDAETKPKKTVEAGDVAPPAPTIAVEPMKDLSARFGEIVALLMQSPMYRHTSLADLDWLVVPALLSGQFSIMSARKKDAAALAVPVGLALWASVSPEVDAKLEAQKKARLTPFRLAPGDWKSGEIIWLLDLIAAPQVQQAFFDKLVEGAFKGRTVKRYFAQPARRVAPPNSDAAGAPLTQ